MTATQILALYGAPWILVLGGAFLAWRNHAMVKRAIARADAAARTESASLHPTGTIEDYAIIPKVEPIDAAIFGPRPKNAPPPGPAPRVSAGFGGGDYFPEPRSFPGGRVTVHDRNRDGE